MIYLGTPGRMVGLKCPSSQVVEDAGRHSFATTLEGQRFAQVAPASYSARSWELNVGLARPEDVATLSAFSRGVWGPGPFRFIPAGAGHQNLLTPLGSWCMNLVSPGSGFGGPVNLPDGGVAPESLLRGAAGTVYVDGFGVPVLPGQRMTVSAWVRGAGGRVGLAFSDVGGSWFSTTSSGGAVGDGWQRVHVSVVPPEDAASARFVFVGGDQLTCPQVTWTDGVRPWVEGEGAPAVVVSAVSRDTIRAMPDANYSRLVFTVTEVG